MHTWSISSADDRYHYLKVDGQYVDDAYVKRLCDQYGRSFGIYEISATRNVNCLMYCASGTYKSLKSAKTGCIRAAKQIGLID